MQIIRKLALITMVSSIGLTATFSTYANSNVSQQPTEQITITKGTKLTNKIALITGAASGNGQAMAKLFAAQGATVVIVDIDGQEAEQTAQAINKTGGKAFAIVADVTKQNDVERMIDTTVKKYGRLDILVNNAGVFDMLLPVAKVTDDIWLKTIDTNLTAPMRAIRQVIPQFEKQGGGIIINTASIAGFTGARGGGAAYVASKHGLVGLTKNVAYTYQHKNIRCNAIAPGRINTNLRDNSQKLIGVQDAYNKTIKDWKDIEQLVTDGYITNPRRANPDEIAKVALFLASDDASFVNGSIITADGGWTSY